ncbi:MAG: PAS domain-containing protein [Acidobacteriota bacterium]
MGDSTIRERFTRLSRYHGRLDRLCRLTAGMARFGTEKATFQKIVDIPFGLFDIESAHLALVDRFDRHLFCVARSRGARRGSHPATCRLEDLAEARTAIKRRRTVVVREPPGGKHGRAGRARRSVAYLPLVSSRRGFGLLILRSRPGRDLAAEDLELARHFTGFATVAIENARLLSRLAETEKRFRSLVENVPAIVYSCEVDPPYRTLYVSPQVERILGYSARDWTDHDGFIMTIIHPDDADQVIRLGNEAAKRRGFSVGEYRVFDKQGEIRWLRDEGILVTDPLGRPVAWHGVVVDITGAKRMEERARRKRVVPGIDPEAPRPTLDA